MIIVSNGFIPKLRDLRQCNLGIFTKTYGACMRNKGYLKI